MVLMAAVAGVVTGIFSVETDRPGRGDTARFTAHSRLSDWPIHITCHGDLSLIGGGARVCVQPRHYLTLKPESEQCKYKFELSLVR